MLSRLIRSIFSIYSVIDTEWWDDKLEIDHIEMKGDVWGKHHKELHVPHPNGGHHYPESLWVPFNGDEEDHHRHNDHDGRLDPPHSRVEEDYFFIGSLGYGDAGDMCMYQSFQKLAAPRQSSVANLHSLKEQHRIESMAKYLPGGSVFFLSSVVFLGFLNVGGMLARSCGRCLKRDRQTENVISATYSVTEDDPALRTERKPSLLLVFVDG